MDTSSLFKSTDSRAITYQESHDELMSAYDSMMGFDTGAYHVAMSDAENPLKQSLLELWLETYAREGIWDVYHVDFDTFLDRPRYEILMMIKNIAKLREIKKRAAQMAKEEQEREELSVQRRR